MLPTHDHPTLARDQMLAPLPNQNLVPTTWPVQNPMPTPNRALNQMRATSVNQMLVAFRLPPSTSRRGLAEYEI
jgi:hypothetical protein